jgi:hypothetical protein
MTCDKTNNLERVNCLVDILERCLRLDLLPHDGRQRIATLLQIPIQLQHYAAISNRSPTKHITYSAAVVQTLPSVP